MDRELLFGIFVTLVGLAPVALVLFAMLYHY